MKTLRKQIAEAIYEAWIQDERASPLIWRFQIRPGYEHFYAFGERFPNESLSYEEYKNIEGEFPKRYSYEEYEEALCEIFPGIERTEDLQENGNVSIRLLDRKFFEDNINRVINEV